MVLPFIVNNVQMVVNKLIINLDYVNIIITIALNY